MYFFFFQLFRCCFSLFTWASAKILGSGAKTKKKKKDREARFTTRQQQQQ